MKRLFSTAVIVLSIAVFMGCSSTDPDEAIIGTWLCQDTTQEHIFLCELTFDNEGGFSDRDGDDGAYIISGNVLHLDYEDFQRNTLNFRFQGKRLILTSGDDYYIELARQ